MKQKQIGKTIALFIAALVIMLPICFATEINPQYDANGNLVTGDGLFRVYNSFNQLSKVYNGTDETGILLQEYQYHPTEERVLVKRDNTKNETTYYFSKNFVRVVNDNTSVYNYTYIYFEGQLVAQEVDGVKVFISGDLKGSATVVTSDSRQIIENSSYTPFGERLTPEISSVRYGYEGKEDDSVIKSTDFHFRQYDPTRGQFNQPDTLIQNVYDPQMLNRYMFERGNPYKYTDPTGHIIPLAVVGAIVLNAIIGAAVSAITDATFQYIATGEVDWSHVREEARTGAIVGGIFGGFGRAVTLAAEIAQSTVISSVAVAQTGYEFYTQLNKYIKIGQEVKEQGKLNPEKEIGSFNYKGKKYTIKTEATDKDGKTAWERQIEKNKQESAKKEAQGLKFQGYGSDKKAIWK